MRNLALITLAALLSLTGPADALVMCGSKKPDGTLREGASIKLRSVCRSNEVALDPIALGLQGPQGPVGPQGQTGPTGPQGSPGVAGDRGPGALLVDSLGSEVGVFLDIDASGGNPNQVLMGPVLVDGKWMSVAVAVEGAQGLRTTLNPELLFESVNCVGPPMVVSEVGEQPFLRGVPVGFAPFHTGPGAALYYPTEVGVVRTLRSKATSVGAGTTDCGNGRTFIPPFTCCENLNPSLTTTSSPAASLDISGFVPPFVVKAP